METIGSKRSYALIWCMPNNDDDDDSCVYFIAFRHLYEVIEFHLFLFKIVKVNT